MKRLLRPQIVVVGTIALALLAWSVSAAAAGPRHGSHIVVRSSESVRADSSPADEPTEKPQTPAQAASPTVEENAAEEAAEEQNEQAEAPEDENEDEQEVEKPAPPAPSAPPAQVTSKTFKLVGGTVTFSCSGNTISLVSAVPNAGFSVEAEREDGGREVKVKFESATHKSEIGASCVAGQVTANEIQEETD